MPIPLSQLDTWSNLGATAASSTAYKRIRDAIFKDGSPVKVSSEDVFLQGSYTNSTNIYGDSDVDVVILYKPTFYKDITRLSPDEVARLEAICSPATYGWHNLRDDVVTALRNHFGHAAVTPGNKSIKVDTGAGRLPADVVPTVQFRRYASFPNIDAATAHWGVTFFDISGNQINNYPKYHIERGEAKNSTERTGGHYKKTVRVFKNLRNHMIERGYIADKKVAPSYFIECALHNVPDSLFSYDLSVSVPAIIDYLRKTPAAAWLCQNGVTTLIGDSSTQWSQANYTTFLNALKTAWDNYYA